MLKQSWSTSPEELKQLHDEGQTWRQGPWASDETEKLKQNILNYCQVNIYFNLNFLKYLNFMNYEGTFHQ